jgi:hypothetical protein
VENSINKGELIDAIAIKAHVTKKEADAVLSATLETIVEVIALFIKINQYFQLTQKTQKPPLLRWSCRMSDIVLGARNPACLASVTEAKQIAGLILLYFLESGWW